MIIVAPTEINTPPAMLRKIWAPTLGTLIFLIAVKLILLPRPKLRMFLLVFQRNRSTADKNFTVMACVLSSVFLNEKVLIIFLNKTAFLLVSSQNNLC